MHFSFVNKLGYCCEGACFPKFQGVKQTSDKRHYDTHWGDGAGLFSDVTGPVMGQTWCI